MGGQWNYDSLLMEFGNPPKVEVLNHHWWWYNGVPVFRGCQQFQWTGFEKQLVIEQVFTFLISRIGTKSKFQYVHFFRCSGQILKSVTIFFSVGLFYVPTIIQIFQSLTELQYSKDIRWTFLAHSVVMYVTTDAGVEQLTSHSTV